MTISALPVTARVLQELNLYRTDTGLLIMGALTINDVSGWLVFAVILGLAGKSLVNLTTIPIILISTIIFAGVALSFGRKFTNGQTARMMVIFLNTSSTIYTEQVVIKN